MYRARDFQELCERIRGKTPVEISIHILAFSWKRETSDPLFRHDMWKPEQPYLGQRAVTALLFQQRHAGELLMVLHDGRRRFYNELPDGRIVSVVDAVQDKAPPVGGTRVDRLFVLASEVELEARLDLYSSYVERTEEHVQKLCGNEALSTRT